MRVRLFLSFIILLFSRFIRWVVFIMASSRLGFKLSMPNDFPRSLHLHLSSLRSSPTPRWYHPGRMESPVVTRKSARWTVPALHYLLLYRFPVGTIYYSTVVIGGTPADPPLPKCSSVIRVLVAKGWRTTAVLFPSRSPFCWLRILNTLHVMHCQADLLRVGSTY